MYKETNTEVKCARKPKYEENKNGAFWNWKHLGISIHFVNNTVA